ncbi:hypothetical protein B0H13DRAFT_2012439 [Mycena leptocephala]|nr:hypothetical protein B0H13DRAFT_2012439 [Mycena leptocephala]
MAPRLLPASSLLLVPFWIDSRLLSILCSSASSMPLGLLPPLVPPLSLRSARRQRPPVYSFSPPGTFTYLRGLVAWGCLLLTPSPPVTIPVGPPTHAP